MGEMVAFRNHIPWLDPTILADDLVLANAIRKSGLQVVYAADALVLNRGPETLGEFIAQRERWCVSNMQVAHALKAPPSTLSVGNVLRAAAGLFADKSPRIDWFLLTAGLEAWCRLRAFITFAVMRRADRYRLWDSLASTKTVIPRES
jgi:cellulose synthase/poly-beta-1,6-N-acetylglucosamine synthase-like glycosyltransferase